VVKIDDLSKEIAKQLSLYTEDVEAEVEEAKDDVSKESVKLLRQKSPKKSGDYAKGWSRKKINKDFVVYNRTAPQLTHLLEHGHVNQDGGRTPGEAHIRPVEEEINQQYLDRVERAIKS
jgi:hypothetical protein